MSFKTHASPVELTRLAELFIPVEEQTDIQKLLIGLVNKHADATEEGTNMTNLPELLTDLDDVIMKANKLRYEAVKIIHQLDQ